MRTYRLIIATLVVLGAAFFFYWRSQPAALTQREAAPVVVETAPSPQMPKIDKIGPGDRPWVRMIDSEGKVSSQYRAREYSPRPDGTVHLIDVEADFFLGQHQRLHVTGADGDVVMHGSSNIGLAGGSSQSGGQPSRGRLNDVKMHLVDDSLPADSEPLLTMTTNNIEFDNESFLITTGGYKTPDGTEILPDQVPVEVRGEYDFDGRGLTLRWNDRDDRLELLEIAHGEELRINHPSNRNSPLGPGDKSSPTTSQASKDSEPSTANATAPPASPPASAGTSNSNPTPVPAAQGDSVQNSTTAAASSTSAKKPDKGAKPVYLATFEQAVRVTQGDQLLMTGDEMRVHFRMKESQTASTTRPSEQNAPQTANGSEPGATAVDPTRTSLPSPVTPGEGQGEGSPVEKPVSDDGPRTSPPPEYQGRGQSPDGLAADIPIVVRWTGKLRIVPETSPPPKPIPPGDSIVELIGKYSPVFVFRAATEDAPASEIRCAQLAYATADGSALLVGSDAYGPVQLTRHSLAMSIEDEPPPPTVITTDVLDFVGSTHTATLTGQGHAVIPVAQNTGDKPGEIDAKWSKQAVLQFLSHGSDELAIQRATFNGDVVITHPQLGLTAQELTLIFAPQPAVAAKSASSQSTLLSEVIATDRADHVHCAILDAAGKQQTVDCQALDLQTGRTADGRVLARQVDASGNVVAFDGMQKLNCDRVRMLLRPALAKARPQPEETAGGVDTSTVELERLDARGNVLVTSKDNTTARSDQLLVASDPDGPHVLMTGDSLCRVTDAKRNELTGEKIVIQPRQQLAHVIGYGTLHTEGGATKTASAPGTAPSRRMDVIFAEGADLDGERNLINLRGNCEVTMPDSDGTINTAHADRIHIDLQDKPKTGKPTSAAVRPPASTDDANLLGNKEPRMITLDGNAQVESNLSDATGILRQSELKAPRILYAVSAMGDISARTLVVPSAGVMLVRDHRAPLTSAGNEDTGLGTGRGATAFQWTRKLTYSEDAHTAIMNGNVFVRHVSDNAKELPVQLTSDQITALFEPAAAKKSTTTQPSESQAMELKSMDAMGNVVVNRGGTQINAQRVFFEPASHWMTAQGTAATPVTVLDENGTQSSVDEVRWNTQTWDFSMNHAVGDASR